MYKYSRFIPLFGCTYSLQIQCPCKAHQEQIGVLCLAQGHLRMLLGWTGIWTSDLPNKRHPALSRELQLLPLVTAPEITSALRVSHWIKKKSLLITSWDSWVTAAAATPSADRASHLGKIWNNVYFLNWLNSFLVFGTPPCNHRATLPKYLCLASPSPLFLNVWFVWMPNAVRKV